MRAASKIAPAPRSGPKICDEWPVGPGDVEAPVRAAAPAHDGVGGIAVAVLETNRDGGALRGRDECGARGRQRASSRFLVACHHDSHVHAIEQPAAFSAFKRLQHDDVAALHVDDARAARMIRVHALESLERTVLFEHRVEMADEQDLRRRAWMCRDQMARAIPRRAVHPLGLESERVELRAEDRADLTHAVEVLGAAVDVDDARRASRVRPWCSHRHGPRSRVRRR